MATHRRTTFSAEKCASCARPDAAASHRLARHALDPAHYVAIAEFRAALTELNALKAERARETRRSIRSTTAIRAGKLVPAHREWAIAYCAADARGFDTFAAQQPSVLPARTWTSAAIPATAPVAISTRELAICARLGLSIRSFVRRKRGAPTS